MTYPDEEYISEDSDSWDEDANQDQQVAPVPVRVIATDTEVVAPQFANWRTWSLPQFGAAQGTQPVYVQILQKRQNRYKAQFRISFGSATSVVLNSSPDQLTNNPPNGFVIASTDVGGMPDYHSERAVYAVAVGGANATISVLDESYGQQQ